MTKEPTNREILTAVQTLTKKVDGMDTKVGNLDTRVGGLETSQQEILETMQDFSTHVDERFNIVETRLDKLEGRMDNNEQNTKSIKCTMVTKDYFDDKLSDLRGDFNVLMRKEDTKLVTLVDVLSEKSVLNKRDRARILKQAPLPRS